MRRHWLRFSIAALLILALTGATTSPNKGYTVPTPGSDTNVWGTMLQGDLNAIDNNLGGVCTIPITSPATTATIAQSQCLVQKLTGVLSQNTTYTLPVTGGGLWLADNETTGGFTLTILTQIAGGSGFAPPQGARTLIYSDGTSIFQAAPAGLPPTGTVGGDLCGSLPNPTVCSTTLTNPLASNQGGTLAGSIVYDSASSLTPPAGYVLGNGQALSRTAFPVLNARYAAVGYPYGAGDGSTTFNVIDCRARVVAGQDPGNGTARMPGGVAGGVSAGTLGSAGGEASHTQLLAELASHGHTINDPGHVHFSSGGQNFFTSGTGSGVSIGTGGQTFGESNVTTANTTGITINSAGGGQPFNVTQPTVIANCLVRAF